LSGITELVGGLALAAGFLTPLGAAAVGGVMLTAVASAHWGKGFFLATGGCEFPLALGVVALACAFSGGGRWSLDNALDWTLRGGGWGIAAVILAVVASVAVMAAGGVLGQRRGGEQLAT
jgi:putative oxidoreductase